MNLQTYVIPLLSLGLGATPLFAQGEEEKAFEVPAEARGVLWDGTVPDNVVFADPSVVGARELNANDPMMQPFLKLLNTYTDFVDENLKGFDGKTSQREAAFHAVNLILVSGVVWPPTMTAAGVGIGAIALSESGPGAIGGGVAGGVIGGAAGTGAMCAQIMLAVALGLHVNEKYPDVGTRDLPMADGSDVALFDDPEAWVIEDLRVTEAEEATDGVGDRDIRGGTERRATGTAVGAARRVAGAASRYAGPWESLFVHMVRDAAAPEIDKLARYWERYPGLSAAQRAQLTQAAGLKPFVAQIAYIRANGRLSSNSKPAMPLSGWQRTVSKLLSGDQGAVQQLWLDCFAIGNTRLDVRSDKLTWTTPTALRRVGAPSSFSTGIGAINARVTGFGGSLAASVEPGDFRITLGSAQISGDRVRVRFTIGKGRLLDLAVKGEFGPAKHQFKASPSLRRDLVGNLEFAVVGYGLQLKKVSLGRVDLNLGVNLPAALKPIEGLLKDFEAKVVDAAEDLIGKKLGFEKVFDDLDKYVPKQLLELLNKTAGDYGLAEVQSITSLALRNGKLEANVRAVEWNGVPSLDAVVRRFGARIQQLAR
ncbi:MAG: hypothetical protein H6838_00900 [Planctomycetes bacterium]|nr:hypothetical protein [Planctomycetota bacterium]MCB9884013.1 hypothetical protein [Planctomycetota bacterium]